MKATKTVGVLSIIAGIVMIIAGAATYATVAAQLKAEAITVPGDSAFMGGMFAGKPVAGPLSAYAQADIINHHALAGTDGKTYAELGALANEAKEKGDAEAEENFRTQRATVMNASFLRASLFSSVIAFGVAALVMGLGLIVGLIGWALTTIRSAE
ncbi:MAG: aromatic ring-opening dioxygenase LigA [Tessaracoccus sp.]|uniref:aromatic ring-opening dioxygenase LigA n=1 Tax=Tessaracoccus sp. TaxID=1971211 RepID=UPI001ED23A59|nr:aromatic ring-opening dioxygenase LigA [Tessaracoccus sp.]MBK7821446.1 aromatic ring-opening dioxygenase LigA [Tessaracoccus sp.]